MPTAPISRANFTFLKELKKNNNRDWFNANKDRYIAAHENTIEFVDGAIDLVLEVLPHPIRHPFQLRVERLFHLLVKRQIGKTD